VGPRRSRRRNSPRGRIKSPGTHRFGGWQDLPPGSWPHTDVAHSSDRKPLWIADRRPRSGGIGPDPWRMTSGRGVHRHRRTGPGPCGVGGESGWPSRSAVRTGRLRRSPAVHSRPIDLVVFQEPSHAIRAGNLVLKRASRLDAFSAYPFPTWLPDDAPSGTAGTPEVGPPQSSRTRGDPSQVSYAHGR
jgi:hypothetical protein